MHPPPINHLPCKSFYGAPVSVAKQRDLHCFVGNATGIMPVIGGIMTLFKRTPEQNAAFERCVGFLAEMIEKYSGRVEFPVLPADSKTSWDNLSNPSSQTNSIEPLTDDMAA